MNPLLITDVYSRAFLIAVVIVCCLALAYFWWETKRATPYPEESGNLPGNLGDRTVKVTLTADATKFREGMDRAAREARELSRRLAQHRRDQEWAAVLRATGDTPAFAELAAKHGRDRLDALEVRL